MLGQDSRSGGRWRPSIKRSSWRKYLGAAIVATWTALLSVACGRNPIQPTRSDVATTAQGDQAHGEVAARTMPAASASSASGACGVGVWRFPRRPSGAITLGYGVRVPWASSPHNGIDFTSALKDPVYAVASGRLHSYTKPNASRFGSINPDGNGPAIWQQVTTSCGEPIYVIYGHTADSWIDRTVLRPFAFVASYTVRPAGTVISYGSQIGLTAPFYNSGKPSPHLHISVFKPNKQPGGAYYGPPSNGWGYSDTKLSTGEYLDPQVFFSTYQVY